MRNGWGVLTGVGLACGLAAALGAQTVTKGGGTPAEKVPIVAVTGCLKQQGPSEWILANGTEPEASTANASPKKDGTTPALGKRQFKLIGISEYNLPAMKDHTVVVKALHIKATPTDRLNLTSVQSLSPSCGGGK